MLFSTHSTVKVTKRNYIENRLPQNVALPHDSQKESIQEAENWEDIQRVQSRLTAKLHLVPFRQAEAVCWPHQHQSGHPVGGCVHHSGCPTGRFSTSIKDSFLVSSLLPWWGSGTRTQVLRLIGQRLLPTGHFPSLSFVLTFG